MRHEILVDRYIHSTLLRDLVGHDHRPTAFLVYFWLYAEQQELGKPIEISYATLAENTGLSRSASQAAIAWLVRRKLLSVVKQSATATPIYSIKRPWHREAQGDAGKH